MRVMSMKPIQDFTKSYKNHVRNQRAVNRRTFEDGSNKINGILAHKKSMIGGGGFNLHYIFIHITAFKA
jgi:hypothetical protein